MSRDIRGVCVARSHSDTTIYKTSGTGSNYNTHHVPNEIGEQKSERGKCGKFFYFSEAFERDFIEIESRLSLKSCIFSYFLPRNLENYYISILIIIIIKRFAFPLVSL